MSDFVPEVVVAGLVPQEHDIRRLGGGKLIHLPAAGGVYQENITISPGDFVGFLIIINQRHRQDIDGKFGFGCKHLEFGFDSPGLLINVGPRLKSSITAPALLGFPFLDLIRQNGFNPQRSAARQSRC